MNSLIHRLFGLVLGISLALASGCSSSNFSGATGGKKEKDKNKDKDGNDGDDGDEAGEAEGKDGKEAGEGEAEGGGAEGAESGDDLDGGGIDVSDLGDGRVRQRFDGEVETVKSPVDIVFAMDTSGSMLQEKSSLEASMATFITAFETKAKNTKYQVYMVGGSFNFPTGTDGKITKVNQTVSSTNALVILKKLFSGQLTNPTPFRDEAKKQVVVVSDDNARTEVASTFKTFLDATPAYKDKTSMNAIIGLPGSVNTSTCKIVKTGTEYITLGADPVYGGLVQDLCKTDWDKLLDDLANKIIKETARFEFELKKKVDSSQPIDVTVDGKKVDEADYDFDETKNAIVFKDDKKPEDGAKVVVVFTPK